MIKFPSTFKEYTAYWSVDPAFIQAPKPPQDETDLDAVEKFKAAVKDYLHKWKVARETGDHSALRIEGADEPTAFTLRPLTTDALAIIIGAVKKGLPPMNGHVLAFQWALKDVALKGAEVTFHEHPEYPQLGRVAQLTMFDKLGAPAGWAVQIAAELGEYLVEKATPSPNS